MQMNMNMNRIQGSETGHQSANAEVFSLAGIFNENRTASLTFDLIISYENSIIICCKLPLTPAKYQLKIKFDH